MNKIQTEIKLLLVDDHNVVRSGLRSLLQSVPNFQVVGEAGDGQNALRLCEQLRPDIVLMDLRMPGVDGVQAIGMIKHRCPSIHLIALTMHDGDEDVCQAVQSGAAAFVLKSAGDEELIGTIREVIQGQYHFPLWLSERISRRDPARTLTESEIRLLVLVAEGKSNKEMGDYLHVPEHKIKNNLKTIFLKLGCLNRTEAVSIAIARGFLRSKS